MTNHQTLNALLKEYTYKLVSANKVRGFEQTPAGMPEITITLGTGVTDISNNQHAFILEPATNPIEIKYVPARNIVIRRFLTSEQVDDIIKNHNTSLLFLLLEEMVTTLENQLGFPASEKHTGIYGTFESPSGEFIRACENPLKPYELRLYSNCKKVIYK